MTIDKDDSIRLKWLYFILAIFVLLQHTINITIYSFSSEMGSIVYYFEVVINRLFEIAVPMYFVLSGYMFYQNIDWGNILSKWKRRIFTLVIPYLIWNFIAYVYWCVVTNISFVSGKLNMETVHFSIIHFLKEVIVWNNPLDVYGPFWFIHSLIIFVMLAPLIHMFNMLMNKIYGGWIKCVIYVVVVAFLMYKSSALGWYMFGVMLSNVCKKEIWKFQQKYSKVCWIFGVIWIVMASCDITHAVWITILNLIGMIFLWLLIYRKRFSKENGLLIWKTYFWIYCGHYLLLETIEKLWYLMTGDHVWCALVDLLLIPLIVLVILEATGKLFSKICPKVWKVAIGQR